MPLNILMENISYYWPVINIFEEVIRNIRDIGAAASCGQPGWCQGQLTD